MEEHTGLSTDGGDMMPYKSEKQRKFFHTQTAKTKGITPKMVKEFDRESKGKKLPEKKRYSSFHKY